PVLDCSVAGRYAVDKQNYELKWTKVLAGTPTLITLGDRNYFGNDYELMQSASEGSYSLRIKKVNFTNDNGEFFCSLSVIDASKQFTARRAVVVVLGKRSAPTTLCRVEWCH
uniref:Ig-like domain-containing protein n=1 Tax=Plectus sambesii TaxID=2011161 RepID=A0A914V9K4_9BILA